MRALRRAPPQANGENNKDGENHNLSWNCGAEGPTPRVDINRCGCCVAGAVCRRSAVCRTARRGKLHDACMHARTHARTAADPSRTHATRTDAHAARHADRPQAAPAPDAQHGLRAAAEPRRAHAADGRRVRAQQEGQQQHVLPRQRAQLGGLGAGRAGPVWLCALHAAAHQLQVRGVARCMRARVCVFVFACVCVCVFGGGGAGVPLLTQGRGWHALRVAVRAVRTPSHAHTHTRTRTHTHARTHTHTHAHTHTHTRTHTHTHTPTTTSHSQRDRHAHPELRRKTYVNDNDVQVRCVVCGLGLAPQLRAAPPPRGARRVNTRPGADACARGACCPVAAVAAPAHAHAHPRGSGTARARSNQTGATAAAWWRTP
jgi:hypothetical protein